MSFKYNRIVNQNKSFNDKVTNLLTGLFRDDTRLSCSLWLLGTGELSGTSSASLSVSYHQNIKESQSCSVTNRKQGLSIQLPNDKCL